MTCSVIFFGFWATFNSINLNFEICHHQCEVRNKKSWWGWWWAAEAISVADVGWWWWCGWCGFIDGGGGGGGWPVAITGFVDGGPIVKPFVVPNGFDVNAIDDGWWCGWCGWWWWGWLPVKWW